MEDTKPPRAHAGIEWSCVCECLSHAEPTETAGRFLRNLTCASLVWPHEVEATSSASPACPQPEAGSLRFEV